MTTVAVTLAELAGLLPDPCPEHLAAAIGLPALPSAPLQTAGRLALELRSHENVTMQSTFDGLRRSIGLSLTAAPAVRLIAASAHRTSAATILPVGQVQIHSSELGWWWIQLGDSLSVSEHLHAVEQRVGVVIEKFECDRRSALAFEGGVSGARASIDANWRMVATESWDEFLHRVEDWLTKSDS